MRDLTVRPFAERDLGPASELWSSRHAANRARLPMLSAKLDASSEVRPRLERLANNSRATGVVAESDGQLIGFLFGDRQLHPPDSVAAQFIEPNSITVPVDGHAVSPDVSAFDVYRSLYAAAADGWLQDGFFTHSVHVTPGDPGVEDAWFSLGFGRKTTAAARDLVPVAGVRRVPGVEIHTAGAEDIEVVHHLEHTNLAHHVTAPMWWPLLPGPAAAMREFLLGSLVSPDNPHLVAYVDGKPAGMNTFLKHGFQPSTIDRDEGIYLLDGIVEEDARGSGLGKLLLDEGVSWARDHGYRWCILHFATANPSGGPFWLGQGFVPCEETLLRRVDDRVAWARG